MFRKYLTKFRWTNSAASRIFNIFVRINFISIIMHYWVGSEKPWSKKQFVQNFDGMAASRIFSG